MKYPPFFISSLTLYLDWFSGGRSYLEQSQKGITIIVVTHEEDIAAYTQRTIYLRDGKIIEEKKR